MSSGALLLIFYLLWIFTVHFLSTLLSATEEAKRWCDIMAHYAVLKVYFGKKLRIGLQLLDSGRPNR